MYVGTSGFSHTEWRCRFYPDRIPQKDMLAFYGERFSTVEINNTFRQPPTEKGIESWAAKVPESFRFALKCRQTITHFKRLKNVEKELDEFLAVASLLRERLGPILVQLPESFRKDVDQLDVFLRHVPSWAKLAFEFRHASWLNNEVYDCLRTHSAALAVTDRDDLPGTGLVHTADWGYVRLWRSSYTDEQLQKWIDGILSENWADTYVIFMHSDPDFAGPVTEIAPGFAARFMWLAGE